MNKTNSFLKKVCHSVPLKQVGCLIRIEENEICNQAINMGRKWIEGSNVLAALGIGVWKMSQSVDVVKAHPLQATYVFYALKLNQNICFKMS